MKRVFALFIALVLGVLVFSACGEETPKGDTKLDKQIIGTVNGEEITQADYNLIYRTMYNNFSQYEQYYGTEWFVQPYDGINTVGQAISSNTAAQFEQLIAARVLAEEEYKIKADSKEIDKAVQKEYKSFRKNFKDNDEYEKFLGEAKTTDKAVKKSIRMSEIIVRLQEELTAEGGKAYISDEEALEAFGTEKMRVQHILVSTQAQTDPETGETKEARSDAEALKIVNEILDKLAKGEDFDKLIDEYDEDPGMESGKFYVFGTGEMVQEFETASMELKVGEYTKAGVKTDYGYHIIKKYDLNAELPEFKEYKEGLLNQKLGMILSEKASELETEWKTEEIDKYVFNWVNEIRSSSGLEPITEEMMGIKLPSEEELSSGNEEKAQEENKEQK